MDDERVVGARVAEKGEVGMCAVCGCPQCIWLRVGTVARALGVTPQHVRNLLGRGDLAGFKSSRRQAHWRVRHSSVDAFILQDQEVA